MNTTEFETATFRWSHSLFYQIHPRKKNKYTSVMKKIKKKYQCMKQKS